MEEKKRGGYRQGAGRKPSEIPSRPINVRIEQALLNAMPASRSIKDYINESIREKLIKDGYL